MWRTFKTTSYVDAQAVEMLLNTCGEEMEDAEYEHVMRICGNSTKGKFDVKKVLKTYADLAIKVGTLDKSAANDAEELCKTIGKSRKPRYDSKAVGPSEPNTPE